MKKRTVRAIRTMTKVAMVSIIMVLFLSLLSCIETHYTIDARVDSIEDNTVTFIDTWGYTWEATDVDNIVEGQAVVLKMHTNYTDSTILDDIIVGIKPTAIHMK